MAPIKATPFDQKSAQLFTKNAVVHLQKTLRVYDGKDTQGLIESVEGALKMIKFVNSGKKAKPQKKKKKKAGAVEDEAAST